MTHPIKYYRGLSRRVAKLFKEHPRADMSQPPRRLPPMTQQIQNFKKAVMKRLWSTKPRTSIATFMDRVSKCFNCVHREGDACSHPDCGCVLSKKCWWATERCPAEKPRWLEDTDEGNGV